MIRIVCLLATEDRIWNMNKAFRQVEKLHPGLIQGECYAVRTLATEPELVQTMLEQIEDYDFALVYFHGGVQILPDFLGIWQKFTARMPVYFQSSLPEEVSELMASSGLNIAEYHAIHEYFSLADEANFTAMLLHIAKSRFGVDCEVPKPKPPQREGFYTRDGILDAQQSEKLRRIAAQTERPVVGLVLHQSHVLNGNTRHIDAILEKLAALDALALPLFTAMPNDEDEKLGIRHAMDRFFTWEDKHLPQVLLIMTGFSLTHMGWPGDGQRVVSESIFAKWDVPVLQVMTTRYSEQEYRDLSQGMDPMSLNMNIFYPELDGQIISIPCAAQEMVIEDEIERKIFVPLPDRVDTVCRLAINWSKLSKMPAHDKKIAILFNTMPGNDKIGCAEGLDTFESVHRIIQALQREGVQTDFNFASAQDIADSLTAGLTNELRWISAEEGMRRAAATVEPKSWNLWWQTLSDQVRCELKQTWDEVPGTIMTKDERFLIPGIINGNIFIGLQPSRAFGERAAELAHSTDSTPPYSYLAFYRWLDTDFGVNAIYHVGTHGTVEWLPGKEVGLSQNCYPDICLEAIPHLYPYHIGITGEGVQAKRRSRAVILGHLSPSLDEFEAYEDLAVIDDALKEYHQARQTRKAQVPQLTRRIFDLAEKAKLTIDLGLTEEIFAADPEGTVEAIHLWMGDLKNSVVQDGLHVFGKVPEGIHYQNLLRMLVRVRNGNIPALNDSILVAQGFDPEAIKDAPTSDFYGKTGLMIYDEAVALARHLVSALAERGYDSEGVDALVDAEKFCAPTADLRQVLKFMCETLVNKLNHTTDELDNLIAGTRGCFVPAALGGNPTRGNVDILPTGRNFYASDPDQIPSRAAWQIGCKLAKQMLAKYDETEGGYPENVAMVVWAGNTLKTNGEDFAECLYLLGVRPVYLGESGRVLGVEPISLEELGRPRIDVTLRISGLFRDMYPNLIRLVDEAISSVAILDEPDDLNYIKKHINEDLERLTSEGLSRENALDQAYIRVYGCAPGVYGTGVPHIIDSGKWDTYGDLAQVFDTWSSYAYSAKKHGEIQTEMFRHRMSNVSVTIKNESTIEYDMLSSDDFYGYHGGLVASVRANSGKMPLVISGHTDNPDRPLTREIAQETARVLRSRILNPKWIEGLKRHGFKGAQEIATSLDHLFGWDATAGVGEDWMYQSIAEIFLFNEENRQWMESVNRWSVHGISERLLEAEKRGMWSTDSNTLRRLQGIYMEAEGTIEELSL